MDSCGEARAIFARSKQAVASEHEVVVPIEVEVTDGARRPVDSIASVEVEDSEGAVSLAPPPSGTGPQASARRAGITSWSAWQV
jgi:hypothetical protein